MELDPSDFLTIVNLSQGYTLSRKDMEEASLAQQLCLYNNLGQNTNENTLSLN